jgi:hypothetical protein
MALTKGTTTADLAPAPVQAKPAPATAVSDGLDIGISYQPTLEATPSQEVTVAANAAVPSQEAAVYVAPYEEAHEEGNFDLLDEEVNFTSYPMVKIKAGQITINGAKYAGDLIVKCVQIAFQWIVKSSNEEDAKYFFSPDGGKTDMKGNSGDDIKKGWVENHAVNPKEINVKKYAMLHAVDRTSQAMIAISIPPSSIGRLAGYKNELAPLGRPPITECWTQCLLGDVAEADVKGKKVNWTPWNFKYIGRVTLLNGVVA